MLDPERFQEGYEYQQNQQDMPAYCDLFPGLGAIGLDLIRVCYSRGSNIIMISIIIANVSILPNQQNYRHERIKP